MRYSAVCLTGFLVGLFLTLLVCDVLADEVVINNEVVNLEIGDILYDPDGFSLIDVDGPIDLPFIDPIATGHVAIYAGDIVSGGVLWPQQVVEATLIGGGVYIIHASSWGGGLVDEMYILRPEATKAQRQGAVNFTLKQVGKPYSVNFFQYDNGINDNDWYCSQVIAAGYDSVGINFLNVGVRESPGVNYPASPADIFVDDDIPRDNITYYNFESNFYKRVRNINLGKSYVFINDALDDSDIRKGDVIEIEPGGYLERLKIKTGITLKSSSERNKEGIMDTVIRTKKRWRDLASDITFDIEKRPTVITINSSNVSIENLTITGAWGDDNPNASSDWDEIRGGIKINSGADNCFISNCVLFNNPAGIVARDSSGHDFSYNSFLYNTHGVGFLRVYDTDISRNEFRNSVERGIVAVENEEDCATLSVIEESSDTSSQEETTVVEIRGIRDNLLPQEFVDNYYKSSPYIVQTLSNKPELMIRAVWLYKELEPFIENKDLKFSLSHQENLVLFLDDLKDSLEDKEAQDFVRQGQITAQNIAGQSLNKVLKNAFNKKDGVSSSAVRRKRPVRVFLNFFKDNGEAPDHKYPNELWFWDSRNVLRYKYKDKWFISVLGNRWDSFDGPDNNGNGVVDVNAGGDGYPLKVHPDQYILEGEQEETSVYEWTLY